tara:strand:- start:501 stop:977 length:477 start_codon:yes stop_codon:yes gene_type:complete
MAKYTPEQVTAKRTLASRKSLVRTAIMAGDLKKARAIAAKGGFDIQDARMALIYNHPSEPFFAALEEVVEVKEEVREEVVAVREVVLDNGWPVECEAEIWGPCLNDSLVVVKLDDGRRVSLQKVRGLPYRTQDRVSIRLFKSTGDPLYVELPRAKTAF